jgi:hypothetical protein
MSDAIGRIREFHSTFSFGTHQRRKDTERQARELYRSLGTDDIGQLVALAFESTTPGKVEFVEDILRNLASLQPGSLAPFHRRLIDKRLYYPAIVFNGATSEIAKQILKALAVVGATNSLAAHHILRALAWIGDKVVQQAFASWRRSPPPWASRLHVPPDTYAQQAGWELTPDGSRRDLFVRECHPLVKPGDQHADPETLKVVHKHEGSCPWCRGQMTTMLDLNLSRPELAFLDVQGQRLQIAACHGCACYGTVYTKIDFKGLARWHDGNAKPGYLPADAGAWLAMPFESLVFSHSPRHWIEAADPCALGGSRSQLGGHPTWIQDADYPPCPECGMLMVFVAQLDMENIEECGEGIYYMHLCRSCGVAATHYQQS